MALDLKPLAELAQEARWAVEDLWDEDAWEEDFLTRTDVEQIQWRYHHADCDDLATVLQAATGLPMVALTHTKKGPLHRCVQGEDGRFLDAGGWQRLDEIAKRYGCKPGALRVASTQAGVFGGLDPNDDEERETLGSVLHAALQLPAAALQAGPVRDALVAWGTARGLLKDGAPAPETDPTAPPARSGPRLG